MTQKNTVKITGAALFIVGFMIYLLVFFLANYGLTDKILTEHVYEEEQCVILTEQLSDSFSRNYSTSFEFLASISAGLKVVNDKQLEKYEISESEIDQLIANTTDNKFDISVLEQVFNKDLPADNFKIKSFKDYGGWLDGRTYEDESSLRNDLKNVAGNIGKYEVIKKKGFDKYRIKDLKYSLAKASSLGPVKDNPLLFLLLSFGICISGAIIFFLPGLKEVPGIKNNNIFMNSMTNGGWIGIMTGTFLILFYILLYYFPEHMTNWIIMVDPISMEMKGSEAGRFFLYGFMYTLTIIVMGVRMLIKYRGNRYQQFRTVSVMFFQTAFAFLIPEILLRLNKPYFDFKNIWPLDYDFFFDNELNTLVESGGLGIFMLGWGIALILIAVPVMVYFFGKRWYCSWVCGCGGLAETLGDPYRQLSSKKLNSWKIERWMIHSVLVFAVLMTVGVLYTYWTGSSQILGLNTYSIRETYGFWIGAAFAGVVGTGFYPLMGNRVWCRFGCPLAAYLGLVQRFKSRFRITTNGGQCISCGNCSTYCEMGIDVRWYAQRGQNIVRSSCVGCGICSSVCPRGVLKLENGSEKGRFGTPELMGHDSFKI
jgi:Pyruvate/2-oxoacid:ferredoxin oxidoreductase delta subunit